MTDQEHESEANLGLLSKRLHAGWAKLHPATAKERAAVREAVRKQWEQEQARQTAGDKTKREVTHEKDQPKPGKEQEQTKPTPKPKSQDKDWGHSY